MVGEGPSPKQDYQGATIPNYYNTTQGQYASPFLVDQRGTRDYLWKSLC